MGIILGVRGMWAWRYIIAMVDLTGDSDTDVICESFKKKNAKMVIPMHSAQVSLMMMLFYLWDYWPILKPNGVDE
jgi:hypothetical protein